MDAKGEQQGFRTKVFDSDVFYSMEDECVELMADSGKCSPSLKKVICRIIAIKEGSRIVELGYPLKIIVWLSLIVFWIQLGNI